MNKQEIVDLIQERLEESLLNTFKGLDKREVASFVEDFSLQMDEEIELDEEVDDPSW